MRFMFECASLSGWMLKMLEKRGIFDGGKQVSRAWFSSLFEHCAAWHSHKFSHSCNIQSGTDGEADKCFVGELFVVHASIRYQTAPPEKSFAITKNLFSIL